MMSFAPAGRAALSAGWGPAAAAAIAATTNSTGSSRSGNSGNGNINSGVGDSNSGNSNINGGSTNNIGSSSINSTTNATTNNTTDNTNTNTNNTNTNTNGSGAPSAFGLIGDDLGEFGIDGVDAASPGSGFAPGGYWHQMVKEETSVPHDSDEDLQEGSCGGSSAGTKLMVVSGVSVAKGRGGVRRVGGERGGGGGGGGGRDGGGVSGVSVEVPPSSCGSAPSSLSSSCLSAAGLPSATAVMDVGGGSGKNGRMLPTSSTACVTVPGCDASVIAADPSPVDGGGIGGRGQTARFPPEGPPLSC